MYYSYAKAAGVLLAARGCWAQDKKYLRGRGEPLVYFAEMRGSMNRIDVVNVSAEMMDEIVLDGVSLHMESGKIYGFIGESGGAAAMLIHSIMGLLEPIEGEIRYNGKVLYREMPIIPGLGIVVGGTGLNPNMTGRQNLMHLADIRKKIGAKQVKEALLRVGLNPGDRRYYRNYSTEMKQRIMIAQAIMEKPDVLLLDEPLNGLDAEGTEIISQVLREERDRGCLVAVTGNDAKELAFPCDELYRVSKGKFIL